MTRYSIRIAIVAAVLATLPICAGSLRAQADTAHAGNGASDTTLNVLIVTAHPDDETAFAGAVYNITHHLGGNVDLALVTNGEGGYKYSTFAEEYYGLALTDEAVGREHLPTIRKRELMAGGRIIGIRNYFFMDQQDNRYMLDAAEVLNGIWNVPLISERLNDILTKGSYDYVFVHLPTEGTHGHHKAATILALRAVQRLTTVRKPIVLAATGSSKGDTTLQAFSGLAAYPETAVSRGSSSFRFDRTRKLGFKNALDYKIVVNWLIAEHKSQGVMQTLMNQGDYEDYWFFDLNDPAGMTATAALFQALGNVTYPVREYK